MNGGSSVESCLEPGLLCLWRTWHASSLCHQVPPCAFLPPQVSSRSTHRSLDEINNQPPPANKQNNRPPQLYHQPQKNSTIAYIVHPTTKLRYPTTPFFSSLLEHSMPETVLQFQCLRAEPHVHHTSNLSSTASCKSTCDYSRKQSLV
ncbi:hypothetical protein AVEN_219519-1 [Araneus ventricosus]|uniref:Uncharacterized protein n=1 Tax=Araneus ventricosus TaxID=182803 RepID=A0A4Y2BMW2_ARAVE|nr:hypothetical protein AVEN_219519-1 [Araneus ventricosus]